MAKKPQNFYWEILSPKFAIEAFKDEMLYKIFEDEEVLVKSEKDLHDAIDLKIEIGVQRKIH